MLHSKENVNLTVTWDWRKMFTRTAMNQAANDIRNGLPERFQKTQGNVITAYIRQSRVTIHQLPKTYEDCFLSLPLEAYITCSCVQGTKQKVCSHMAATLTRWEKLYGAFEFTETNAERDRRIEMVTKLDICFSGEKLCADTEDFWIRPKPFGQTKPGSAGLTSRSFPTGRFHIKINFC